MPCPKDGDHRQKKKNGGESVLSRKKLQGKGDTWGEKEGKSWRKTKGRWSFYGFNKHMKTDCGGLRCIGIRKKTTKAGKR